MGISLAVGPRAAMTGRRLGLTAVAALALSLAALVGSARPVVACSCAGFETMKDYATADNAIFTGTAGLRDARGVPVDIDQWLWGQGAAEVVWLADQSFGDGASCGVEPPTPGTSWIWVAWMGDGNDPVTGLCSPHQRLDSPEGAAMLDEALALFGNVEPPGDPPTPDPTAAPAAPTEPGEPGIPTVAIVAAGVGLATLALFGGLVLAARRTRPGA